MQKCSARVSVVHRHETMLSEMIAGEGFQINMEGAFVASCARSVVVAVPGET